jgi:hypothetical protein
VLSNEYDVSSGHILLHMYRSYTALYFSSLMTSIWVLQNPHRTHTYYQFRNFDYILSLCRGSMFALTNTNVLAPLIVGFALEQVAIDTLASHFRSIVTNFQKKGMSEAEMASRLFTLLQTKEVKITTLKSTEVYTEPAEAAEIVSTWANAKNTPSARNELLARDILDVCRFIFLLVILLIMDASRLKLRSESPRHSSHLVIH